MRTIPSVRTSCNFLNEIYPLPIVADERMFHGDLDGMSLAALRREYEQVRFRMLWDLRPHQWLLRRHDLLCNVLMDAGRHAH